MKTLTRALCGSAFLLACGSGENGGGSSGAGATGAAAQAGSAGTAVFPGTGGFGVPGAGGFGNPAGGFPTVGAGGGAIPGSSGFGNPGAGGPGAGGTTPGAGGFINPGAGGSITPSGGAGVGGVPVGTGGDIGVAGGGGSGAPVPACGGPLPAAAFPTTGLTDGTGPNGQYTVVRPTTLGANGFKHPIATWGNGITTTPSYYPGLLQAIAALGIVVIASDSSSVTADLMTQGLDWMIQQNSQAGDYQGKLNTTCLITIGYSLGGGAAVTSGSHKDVAVTVSFHGVTGASNTLHSPLLLLTSDTDTFVVPAQFVTPTFNNSAVQTFYGTLSAAGDPSNLGHLIPVLDVARYEQPAALAWLKLWVYGDQASKVFFYGDTCTLCQAPWDKPQRKNWQ